MNILFLSLCLSLLAAIIECAHIGLFASTGCYSHDIAMRHFADQLSTLEGGGHRITVIQIQVYRFSRSVPASAINHRPPPWDAIVYDGCSAESNASLDLFQRHMWTHLVPFDSHSFDAKSLNILLRLHAHHIDACSDALRDPVFMERVKKLKLDLLVTDYVMNECALRFADLFDVNLVYFSNYPILSSYVADLGISSNPSYVPSVIGFEATRMNFFRRCFNSLQYFLLWSTRQLFDYDAHRVFKNALDNRYLTKRTSKVQFRRALAFSTPFEMIADAARPLATNLQYFGCDHCVDVDIQKNETLPEVFKIPQSYKGVIIVSFGTVTKGDRIPTSQLRQLIRTFAEFPNYAFIWQLDVSADYYSDVLRSANLSSTPANVRLFTWIPMKRLLIDARTVLLISHGGITTCLEALHGALPILGIALQGDQSYNLRRVVEKGVGEIIPISAFTKDVLSEKLSGMIENIGRYKEAASRLRSMLRQHRTLYKRSPSVFWIDWMARHFGRGRNANTSTASAALVVAERFLTLRFSSNWIIYYSLDIFAIPFFFVLLLFIVYTKRSRSRRQKRNLL